METLRTHGNIANIWKQMHAQANTFVITANTCTQLFAMLPNVNKGETL